MDQPPDGISIGSAVSHSTSVCPAHRQKRRSRYVRHLWQYAACNVFIFMVFVPEVVRYRGWLTAVSNRCSKATRVESVRRSACRCWRAHSRIVRRSCYEANRRTPRPTSTRSASRCGRWSRDRRRTPATSHTRSSSTSSRTTPGPPCVILLLWLTKWVSKWQQQRQQPFYTLQPCSVSRHPQFRTKGFCWKKVLRARSCWQQLALRSPRWCYL